MRAAAIRLAGKPHGGGIGRPAWAAEILKQINAARRRARPPKRKTAEAAPVEYLYEPWSWYDDSSETHNGINVIPIVKKTAKRIYYDRTDSWDRVGGTVTLGYISREDFETDTRCRDICPRDIPAGLVCGPHGRSFGHCVHFGVSWRDQDPRCAGPGGCRDPCSADYESRELLSPDSAPYLHGRSVDHHCHTQVDRVFSMIRPSEHQTRLRVPRLRLHRGPRDGPIGHSS